MSEEEFRLYMERYEENVIIFKSIDDRQWAITQNRGACVINFYLIYEDGTVYRSLMQPAHTVEVTHWFGREVIS